MPVHCRVTPSIIFAGSHLYTWVERGTVRVKCLAQEHNTMTPARAGTWTAQSRAQNINHEATVPPIIVLYIKCLIQLKTTQHEKKRKIDDDGNVK